MRVSDEVMGIEISENKVVRKVSSEKVQGENVWGRCRVECFWWEGVDIKQEKRGTFLKVVSDAEIVW